jgi:hypothetical protein
VTGVPVGMGKPCQGIRRNAMIGLLVDQDQSRNCWPTILLPAKAGIQRLHGPRPFAGVMMMGMLIETRC